MFDPLGIMAPGLVLQSRDEVEHFIDECGQNARFRAIYRPGNDEADHEGLLLEAEYFCYVGRQLEHIELFFDEVDAFYRTGDRPPELLALLNFGRNHEVTLRGVVRRPQCKLPADWISETTRLTIFCIANRQDLYMLEEITGIKRDEMRNLEKWEYFDVAAGGVKRCKLENPY